MSAYSRELGKRLAAAILVHNGEISVEDIRALPFVSGREEESNSIVNSLVRSFDVEIRRKKNMALPAPKWEQVIILKDRMD